MKTTRIALCAASMMIASAAGAQTTVPTPTTPPERQVTPSESNKTVMSEAEAKRWVDKRIYSNDNTDIGEVVAFVRDSSGAVTEMHADIGGFLGMGETRVRLSPSQFRLSGDRVMVNMTSDQAKALPKVTQ